MHRSLLEQRDIKEDQELSEAHPPPPSQEQVDLPGEYSSYINLLSCTILPPIISIHSINFLSGYNDSILNFLVPCPWDLSVMPQDSTAYAIVK